MVRTMSKEEEKEENYAGCTHAISPLESEGGSPPPSPSDSISYNEVFEDLIRYFKKYIYFKDPRHYVVFAGFALASYIQNRFSSATYLHLRGPPESGKSRALETLSLVCFNPILVVSSSAAAISRWIDQEVSANKIPTLLIDETNLRDEQTELVKILDAGYRKQGKRLVCDLVGNKYEPKAYNCFCFKVFAGLSVLERTLESRCISVLMETVSDFNYIVREQEMEIDAKILREKILKILPDLYSLSVFFDEFLWPSNHRVREILTPLLTVVPKAYRRDLISLGNDIVDRVNEERRESFSYLIKEAIDELNKDPNFKEGIPLLKISNWIYQNYDISIHTKTISLLLRDLGYTIKRVTRGRVVQLQSLIKVNESSNNNNVGNVGNVESLTKGDPNLSTKSEHENTPPLPTESTFATFATYSESNKGEFTLIKVNDSGTGSDLIKVRKDD
jgi:hypothetical protein